MSVAFEHVDASGKGKHVLSMDLTRHQVSSVPNVSGDWKVGDLSKVNDKTFFKSFISNLSVPRTEDDTDIKFLNASLCSNELTSFSYGIEVVGGGVEFLTVSSGM